MADNLLHNGDVFPYLITNKSFIFFIDDFLCLMKCIRENSITLI